MLPDARPVAAAKARFRRGPSPLSRLSTGAEVSNNPPAFEEFFMASLNHISKAMREMMDDPRARAMPRDAAVTAVVMACNRAAGLAITASEISMEDVQFLSGTLVEIVKMLRQSAADKGLTRRNQ